MIPKQIPNPDSTASETLVNLEDLVTLTTATNAAIVASNALLTAANVDAGKTASATEDTKDVLDDILLAVDGLEGKLNIDGTTNALRVIDYSHHEIHSGSTFYFTEVITLGSSGTQDYLITVPDTTKWPHWGYDVEGSFGVTVELYEATDKSGTTLQTLFNRDRNSATTNTTTIHKGTSGGTTDGTKILYRKSGTGTSGGKLAGKTSDTRERILKRNTKYIFRVTSAAASNDVSVEIDFYEHTNL